MIPAFGATTRAFAPREVTVIRSHGASIAPAEWPTKTVGSPRPDAMDAVHAVHTVGALDALDASRTCIAEHYTL